MSERSAFESFQRMEERIDDMERQALAAAELAGELEGDSLDQDFARLEFSGNADQQLLDLKKKMGMLPAGESEDPRKLSSGDVQDVDEPEFIEDEEAGKND